ncbi:TIGR03668 family PPOX class F420-dependent oxidoreductase [Amycolatopsis rhizosphaerae]|uniref:TIGR03668 family PPOX class F420-dependent oxidoreductase n=1 Tax=Amycolatopsis rhizosphaerae TaxID=2053003 RepID=A0A558B0J0_9PSEU|nr:TIGR03668 family PPOX class F420-dependent oxidoreductase [Amycolatopsis rhizosphaerae]TVT30007.1 TIGR03668 family PPOX class F420-dependent oxidoreductase [Amycolatopsis rhizosphaerae]
MELPEAEARARFTAARVARLATAGMDGVPHLVPVTFAVHDGAVVFAVDHKPKRHADLRRLRNIRANPAVVFLVDFFDEDWTRLWWVRADGRASILTEPAGRAGPLEALRAKYPQYRDRNPEGPVVRTEVYRWRSWSAS